MDRSKTLGMTLELKKRKTQTSDNAAKGSSVKYLMALGQQESWQKIKLERLWDKSRDWRLFIYPSI
jgi:hypothetical protein